MKIKCALFVGILIIYFLTGFSSAQNSFAKTEFTIAGCAGGIPVGCSEYHYCDLFGNLKDVRLGNYKCSLYAGCCASSFYCGCPNGKSSCADDTKRCIPRESNCGDLDNKADCENQNCIWMDGICYDPSDLQSCSSYTNKIDCQKDIKKLGKTGVGSEICRGGVFVGQDKAVDPTSCRCTWNGTKCQITHNTTNINSASNPDFFECKRDISVSPCNDGVQTISWKASVSYKTPGYDPTNDLKDAGCVDTSKEVSCGEEASLLPGFDFINMILVAGLLFAFYFMRKKKIIFLFFLFFSGSVLAETCNNSQQIYRLYQESNSHVQLPSFGENYGVENCAQVLLNDDECTDLEQDDCFAEENDNGEKICQWINSSNQIYNYDVCYNDIFGEEYNGDNPHPNNCDSPLFWVSKMTNTHASLIRNDEYNIPVCYGDLKCTNRSIWIGCNDDEEQVGLVYSRIDNETNLHVSFSYPSTIFGEVICCKPEGLKNSYWSDFEGNEISEANTQQAVRMVAAGSGLKDKLVTYTVWQEDTFLWFDSQVAKKQNYGAAVLDLADFDLGTYYFTSKVEGGREVTSGDLEIIDCDSNTEECNIEPNISIISPACGANFNTGEIVNVGIKLDDPDNVVEGTLSFSDSGEEINVSNLYSGSEVLTNYVHNFSVPGTVKIVLDVNGTSKGIERRFRRAINLIVINRSVAKNYIAACILNPEDLSFIPSSFVYFDAHTTRALSFDPSKTGSSKIQPILLDNVYFKWTFSDDSPTYEGCGSDSSYYSFNHLFADSGNNWGNLEVSLDEGCG